MAGTLTISTLSDGTNSTSSTNCIQGSAKAWINFNGTGTPAIRASYNVSSITDNGTGDYTVNFTNAMPDANSSVLVVGAAGTSANGLRVYGLSSTLSASSVTVFSAYISSTGGSSAPEDEPVMCVSVFR
jgi:hypothetical protein